MTTLAREKYGSRIGDAIQCIGLTGPVHDFATLASAVSTPAVQDDTSVVYISNTVAVRIAIGAAATATATGTLLQPGERAFAVAPGDRVSLLADSDDGKATVTEA